MNILLKPFVLIQDCNFCQSNHKVKGDLKQFFLFVNTQKGYYVKAVLFLPTFFKKN